MVGRTASVISPLLPAISRWEYGFVFNLQKRIRRQGTLETVFIVNKQQLVNTEGKIYSLVQHCDLVAPIVLILRRSIEKQILYMKNSKRFYSSQ